KTAEGQMVSDLVKEVSKVENQIISEKEFKLVTEDAEFKRSILDVVRFNGTRIKQCCVVGNTVIYDTILPERITERSARGSGFTFA
ncbi:MAG: hypothetical protein AAEJ16_09820, partial [Arenicellales bacterium]